MAKRKTIGRIRLQVPAFPADLHEGAKAKAKKQGISLRHFLCNAVAIALGRQPYPEVPPLKEG